MSFTISNFYSWLSNQSNIGQKIYIFKYKDKENIPHTPFLVRLTKGYVPAKQGYCEPRGATKGNTPMSTAAQTEQRASHLR